MKALKGSKKYIWAAALAMTSASAFVGCGGGGSSSPVIYYPYETVYGDVCSTTEPTPGCTFLRSNGERVTVVADPHYNDYGSGSDDLWYVKFYSDGSADVYDQFGDYVETRGVEDFAGWIGGNTIGVGTSGLFWENVSGGTYWLGKNGVLYDANSYSSNYGEAINNKESSEASDTNFAALNSESNKAIVKAGANKLMKEYGLEASKAEAVASALNTWAVAASERGYSTAQDMDVTFKSVFGVNFNSALAAVQDLKDGNTAKMKDMTDRSAAALGLKPHQAQKFIKGMYKKALAQWGYDSETISW